MKRRLTTKQAWLEIARIFEQVGRTRKKPAFGHPGRYGVCAALSYLVGRGWINYAQERDMARQMMKFGPRPDDQFAPSGVYWWELHEFDHDKREYRWAGSKSAKDRATFAALMAEVAE